MDATATVNEQNAEGELQANPDMLLISKPKADWSVRDFRDSIEELASVEAADILLTGDASVALLRKAGLVNDPTGPNPNAYTIDPRFNGLTAEDAKRMRQNAGKYAKALKGYRTSMKRISASGPVQVSYRIGGVLYIEEAHVSPSGEFTPAAYLAKVPDAPRNMTLSVHSQNVSASGIPALPNPEMLWDGVNTATNRLMQGESLQAKTISQEEAKALVAGAVDTAEQYVPREYSESDWEAIFSDGREVETPMGTVTIGAHQYEKLQAKKRTDIIGMIRPTLESPSFIIREIGGSNNGNDAFNFIKVFTDGRGHRWIFSVAISQDDGLFIISNRGIHESQVIKLLEGQETSSLAYVAAENQRTPSFVRRREPTGRPTDNLPSGIGDVNQSLFQSAIEDTDEWRNTEATLQENAANFNAAGMPLAPNGQISKLPYREWVTVRTPSFLNWFGDWMNDPENASKVVDENGEPKIVYHGTPNATFTVFDPEMRDRIYGDMYHKKPDAVWFSDSTEVVDSVYYVDDSAFPDKKGIYSVFLNLRNPVLLDAEGNPWNRLPYPEGMPKRTNPDFRPGGRGRCAFPS